jgi:predicted membrane protein
MQKKLILVTGSSLILIGLIIIAAMLFNFNAWSVLLPVLLIAGGLVLILRPDLTNSLGVDYFVLIGDLSRDGNWQVNDFGAVNIIGDVNLDFRDAIIPDGTTNIAISGFVNDVKLYIPDNVGYAINAQGFVVNTKIAGSEDTRFLMPFETRSANYEMSEKKLDIETRFFVHELKLK